MCGIAGFIGKGTEDDLRKMISCIQHRGPDNQQAMLRESVGFGHARLSIIDPEPAANQPFFSQDQSLAIIFNGEIYNFKDLKKELLAARHFIFRTHSDTEVLLYLYQHYGEEFLSRIEGMFAFAIYDFNENKLLIARDRMGEKPLYYSDLPGAFVFASEIKALLKHPSIQKSINMDALNYYLTFDYVPAPYSIFENVHKLEPGCLLTYQNGKLLKKKYWDINFKSSALTFEQATQEFLRKFENSVTTKLISDVPLGFFLSGGLDSASVAYMAQKNSSVRIKTFSIGFENQSYDESAYAKLVADFLGTEHFSEILTEAQTLNLLPLIGEKLDEPFADPSVIPTYLLSMFTRKHVTVALGGDGSDELLAGYPTFIADRFIKPVNALSFVTKPMLELAVKLLPPSDKNISLDFKIRQFNKGIGVPADYIHTLWLSSFTPEMKQDLWNKLYYQKLNDPQGLAILDSHLLPYKNVSDHFIRNALLYYKTYLPDDILVKVDRASMLASLEVRSPFLDHKLVGFLNSLPQHYKRKGLSTKRLLKHAMRKKLPDIIIDRPKKGFGIPLSSWLRNELKSLTEELLSPASLDQHQFFNNAYVLKLKEDHFSRRANNRKTLWNLMVFQLWYDNFFRN